MEGNSLNKKLPVAAIVGPTATGKSDAALWVAEKLQAEIISVDSAQVYRGLDIGTAKLPPEKRIGPSGMPIPHYLMDIVAPDQPFSVADYQRLARETINDIHRRNKLPLLVGGTGLYYQAVVEPYHFTPMPGERKIRRRLLGLAEERGNNYLYERLKIVDPEAARRIHLHDRRRLVRALEVYELTGRPISEARAKRQQLPPPYRLAAVALNLPRQCLYRRIEDRVEAMIAQGLITEVRELLRKYDYHIPAMQILGYREISASIRGETELEVAKASLKRNTRRLAKRQLTWFRRDKCLSWLDVKGKKHKDISALIIASIREQLLLE